MDAGTLAVQRTARYYLSGPRGASYRSVCFVLHGYGQLAVYFIRNFLYEELKDVLFIAPEALNRFYLEGNRGRVGATWMTREDRLSDIEDYCYYLDTLYAHFKTEIALAKTVGVLGFSQGVATGCRWVARSGNPFDYLVNWAGAFPPDLDFEKALEKVKNIPFWILVGTEDEYISTEKYEEHIQLLKNKGFSPAAHLFEGGHRVYKEPLLKVMSEVLAGA